MVNVMRWSKQQHQQKDRPNLFLWISAQVKSLICVPKLQTCYLAWLDKVSLFSLNWFRQRVCLSCHRRLFNLCEATSVFMSHLGCFVKGSFFPEKKRIHYNLTTLNGLVADKRWCLFVHFFTLRGCSAVIHIPTSKSFIITSDLIRSRIDTKNEYS